MLRSILFLLSVILLCSSISGQGVAFQKTDFAQALSSARKLDKLVFVDAYTSWCGPCKQMDKNTFPDKELGSFFNQHFVSIKLDMERGEGPSLAEQYKVFVYPTLLFINPDGEIVHRNAGFHSPMELIALANTALEATNSLGAMMTRFEEGERAPEFLKEFTKASFEAYDGNHTMLAEAYMDTQEDWLSDINTDFIFSYTGNAYSPLFDFILKNRQHFNSRFGSTQMASRIQEIIYDSIYDTEEKGSLEQVEELFNKAYPERADEMIAKFKINYYRQAGDREKFGAAVVDYLEGPGSKDAEELNELAFTFYRVIENEELLKKAVKWAKKSIRLDKKKYYNHDTLAALYSKLGKSKKAIRLGNKAIKFAQISGEDYSPTQELLESLQSSQG